MEQRAHITYEPIQDYAELYTSSEDAVLKSLNLETHAGVRGAQMLRGHLAGRFLQMISAIVQPKQILELGTYTGYSAICLAKGLQKDGTLHTIDIDDKLQDMRNRYWVQAGLENTIHQYIGEAHDVIPKIDTTFDLVFIDADKKNYSLYFDLVIDKLNVGGIILADNVLFHAEVIQPLEQQSKSAQSIHLFNQKIAEDNRVEQVLLPIRDGIMVIRKK